MYIFKYLYIKIFIYIWSCASIRASYEYKWYNVDSVKFFAKWRHVTMKRTTLGRPPQRRRYTLGGRWRPGGNAPWPQSASVDVSRGHLTWYDLIMGSTGDPANPKAEATVSSFVQIYSSQLLLKTAPQKICYKKPRSTSPGCVEKI